MCFLLAIISHTEALLALDYSMELEFLHQVSYEKC